MSLTQDAFPETLTVSGVDHAKYPNSTGRSVCERIIYVYRRLTNICQKTAAPTAHTQMEKTRAKKHIYLRSQLPITIVNFCDLICEE